jgi:hypothetical protein
LCGSRPILIPVGFGNCHNDIACSNPVCNNRLGLDHKERACRKAWNAANPITETTK